MAEFWEESVERSFCLTHDLMIPDSKLKNLMKNPPTVPRLDRILDALKAKGHRVFSSQRGTDLNIVGIRSQSRKAGRFDDWITVFWKKGTRWEYLAYPATTDPGTKYLKSPLRAVRRKGTAILKAGQYLRAYSIGKHRGKYTALVQTGRVTVCRDNNRDTHLDIGLAQETGYFGINIHRAHWRDVLDEVGGYSAGCQVFQDPRHFASFMALVRKSARTLGNQFTYTLLEDDGRIQA